jgi:dihydroorotate dehydrogenase (NAD+) catalytic subunit
MTENPGRIGLGGDVAPARYDFQKSYEWNYDHVPQPLESLEIAAVPGTWEFCGLPVASPLGIPAGPLLNSRWIHYYASLGFDVLTYKTVRSSRRACHPLPNLLPVRGDPLDDEPGRCQAARAGETFDSWAISFGMPSRDPSEWRADVRRARLGLKAGQLLVVSVVASPEEGATLEDIAQDYARCASWAADAGADAIEANLSCPNVISAEGDLYLRPEWAAAVAERVRAAVPQLPLILKVGVFSDERLRAEFCRVVSGVASAISTTNTVRARVEPEVEGGQEWFGGKTRGIGGAAIAERCWEELVRWRKQLQECGSSLELIAVGGVSSAADVRRRLDAGAHHVQLATAAMRDPLVACRIRRQWSSAHG